MKRLLLIAALTGLPILTALDSSAQQAAPQDEFVFPQKTGPEGVDNYLFSLYYNSGKATNNMRGKRVASAKQNVRQLKVNPSGTSVAVLENAKKGKTALNVYNLWKSNKKIHTFKGLDNASAIAYTPDAKYLAVATPGKVTFYDARKFTPAFEIFTAGTETPASLIAFSPDAATMAISTGKEANVYAVGSKALRKGIETDAEITDIDFSNGNDILAILTNDGNLSLYDTNRYLILQTLEGLGNAAALSFNPDDKFVSVVTGDSRVAVVNRLDDSEREFIDNANGGITDARFVKDNRGNVYLAYTTGKDITYKLMDALPPNYNKLMADEIEDRMDEWMKMMPGESPEDYALRVNEETRMEQMRLFEQDFATRMADGLVGMSTISLGDYSPETGLLSISFDNMPPILLDVPSGDLNSFEEGALEFRNARYALTDNDKFELVYAEVYNKNTGNTYTYDNLKQESLDYLMESEKFVPLETIQQSNLDEITLQDIQEDIVSAAKDANLISDHTHFSVNSKVLGATDDAGNKIANYQITFNYEVDPGFSAQEDFAPGKYKLSESPAALSMMQTVQTALEGEFSKYLVPGKKLNVEITGMADALPIRKKIAYDGIYGNYTEEPVYKGDELTAITVTDKTGITDNDQMAFLRGSAVRDFISTNIKGLDGMNVDYKNKIQVNDEAGGEFRRIEVVLTFVDAL